MSYKSDNLFKRAVQILVKIMKFPKILNFLEKFDENQRDQYKVLSALRGRPSTS